MSLKYTKVTDIVADVLTSGITESGYPIVFTHHLNKVNKASHREHIKLFLTKDKVWCSQFKKPFHDKYVILAGDYRSLTHLKYNSKTNARRNIQGRLVDVEMDIVYFDFIAQQMIEFVSHNGFEGNAHLKNHTNSLNSMRQILVKQRDIIQNALMHPNVSYRAFPRFKK